MKSTAVPWELWQPSRYSENCDTQSPYRAQRHGKHKHTHAHTHTPGSWCEGCLESPLDICGELVKNP